VQTRRVGHKLDPPPEVCWVCRRPMFGIAKQVCVIEATFADEPLWVNSKPSSLAEVKDIVVVDVSVQDADFAGSRQLARERSQPKG
jgi:hypothetical protein